MVYIELDEEACAGCGLCAELLPELFTMDGHKVSIRKGAVPSPVQGVVAQIVNDCPAEALSMKSCTSLHCLHSTDNSTSQ